MIPSTHAVWLCPVDGCDWQLNDNAFDGQARMFFRGQPSIEEINAAVNEQAHAGQAQIEVALRGHLEGHDVLDFVRTIMRLTNDLYQPQGGIRPHTAEPAAGERRTLTSLRWHYEPFVVAESGGRAGPYDGETPQSIADLKQAWSKLGENLP